MIIAKEIDKPTMTTAIMYNSVPIPHNQEKLQEYRQIFPLLRKFLAKHEEKELSRFAHENRRRAEGDET
jgi:hypothetical protein